MVACVYMCVSILTVTHSSLCLVSRLAGYTLIRSNSILTLFVGTDTRVRTFINVCIRESGTVKKISYKHSQPFKDTLLIKKQNKPYWMNVKCFVSMYSKGGCPHLHKNAVYGICSGSLADTHTYRNLAN